MVLGDPVIDRVPGTGALGDAAGRPGFPFFGELVLDCLNRTENATTQEHALEAAELSVLARRDAVDLVPRG